MTFTIPIQHLGRSDIPSAGGKGANLGEMGQASMPVPPGFVRDDSAYGAFVRENGLQIQINQLAPTMQTVRSSWLAGLLQR